jgi:uncharacterized protein (TIGR03086 family)
MPGYSLVGLAATPALATVRAIGADQLTAPTPCREYDVRALINHLLFWGPSLEGAGRKTAVAPPGASDRDVDLTGGDWCGALAAQLDRLVTVWREPQAWEGSAPFGGPMELPAALVGGMVLVELVVHGWDLARATGGEPRWHDEVLAYVHHEVEQTAERGRQAGLYADPVPVPGSAPVLARTLGLTGRDPNWGRGR